MYTDTLEVLAATAAGKARLARTRLPAYLLHAGLAGAYGNWTTRGRATSAAPFPAP